MKLLTFLGTGKYEVTEYTLGERTCLARYAPVAALHFVGADEMTVFATQAAEQAHRETMIEAVG